MTVWDQLISLIITVSPPHDDAFPTLAIRAVRAMINGSGFDQRMLLMATRLAHETDLRNVLVSVLQELLIRCIIRLVLRLIADRGTRDTLIDALTQHFATGKLLRTAALCALGSGFA